MKIVLLCITFLILILLLLLLYFYVPFYLPSYALWAGIIIIITGFLSLIKPLHFLFIHSRLAGLIIFVIGIILISLALFWPVSTHHASGVHQRLDDFLPDYQFRKYHEVFIKASFERVKEAANNVGPADIPAAVFLINVQQKFYSIFRPKRPSAQKELMEIKSGPGGPGLITLDDSNPREAVFGAIGQPFIKNRSPQPQTVKTSEEFRTSNAPGYIRIAANSRIIDEKSGVIRLSTETRILCNDAALTKKFKRYWRIIYPGSSILSKAFLNAVKSKAETEGIKH